MQDQSLWTKNNIWTWNSLGFFHDHIKMIFHSFPHFSVSLKCVYKNVTANVQFSQMFSTDSWIQIIHRLIFMQICLNF